MTPLMLAVKGDHKYLAQYLVEGANADVNIKAEKVIATVSSYKLLIAMTSIRSVLFVQFFNIKSVEVF